MVAIMIAPVEGVPSVVIHLDRGKGKWL